MGSEKEQKVLIAAWSVFLKYGYKRVTMGDIAEAAGISRAALYLLFNKKEDVFRSVVRHNRRQRLEEVRQAITSSPKSVRDKLQLAFEIWSVKPFDMLKNSEGAEELLDGGFAFARDDIQQGYAELESVLAPIIQPLIKGSPLKNISAKQIAHVLVTSTRGFKQVSRNSSEYRNLIESLLTMTLASLERPGNFP